MIDRMYLKLPDPERDHFQGTIDAPIALLEYRRLRMSFLRRSSANRRRNSAPTWGRSLFCLSAFSTHECSSAC